MHPRQIKAGVFLVEGLNSLSTTYYLYYIYFFTQSKFDFDKLQNLLLASGLGLIYAVGSIVSGRYAQRRGYFHALKTGFAVMTFAFAVGSQLDGLTGQLVVLIIGNLGITLTWPALQALVSEGESGPRLQKMVGTYNVVWSLCGSLAYLTGGAMLESWGLRSMFIVPAAISLAQLILIAWLEAKAGVVAVTTNVSRDEIPGKSPAPGPAPSVPRPATFLKMAWLANPFAYLTINTVVAVSPNLAQTLHLSPRYAGYFCSIWMFTRSVAFILFWLWPGWHYRFRWLLNAYLGMIASFLVILLIPNLPVLVLAQIGFGLSIGLIYYSSLFYSMDVGETKGEHGGFHEAAIGAGCCAGPAVGAAALYLSPANASNSTFAVGALLLLGLGGLIRLRYRR